MFLRIDGLATHVHLDGPPNAPPLLLLHSLGTSAGIWDRQVAALAAGFRCIRFDLRGHGLSEAAPAAFTIDRLAADALAVLDALELPRAHVAGISIGGLVAQHLAAAAPDRVERLLLLDTALRIGTPAAWRDRAAAVRRDGLRPVADQSLSRWVTPAFEREPEAAGLRTMVLRTDSASYAWSCEAIADADLSADTRTLRLPALVIVGESDPSTPVSDAEALRDAIPGAELVVIPDASHIPTVERPDAVTDAMRRFLAPEPADAYEAGLVVRRQVLGSAHVERATAAITDLDRPFQHFITRTAWGGCWTRPHFDHRTRSLLTLALLAALGHHEEFRLHVRATRNTGATADDIAELLIQVAVYAGIPAANSAVRVAKETLREMEAQGASPPGPPTKG